MEIISIFNIYYNLVLKDELSERICQKSLNGILKLLVKSQSGEV